MDEESEFDEDIIDDVEEGDNSPDYDTRIGGQRQDVRRKIEELLERKRLREEFGDMDDF